MKRPVSIVLAIFLFISLLLNIFYFIKPNSKAETLITNSIIEILSSAQDIKDSLQNLIEGDIHCSESNMMYIINGKFNNLSSLMRANRSIKGDLISDLEYIAASFIGPGSTNQFTTVGIYDDATITKNEYEYINALIKILSKLGENVAVSNMKYDLDVLNQNIQAIHKQLCDSNSSPYIYILQHNIS